MSSLLNKLLLISTLSLSTGCASYIQNIARKEIAMQKQNISETINDLEKSIFCLRTTAIYETPEGKEISKIYTHGTGFAFKKYQESTYIMTAAHLITNIPSKISIEDENTSEEKSIVLDQNNFNEYLTNPDKIMELLDIYEGNKHAKLKEINIKIVDNNSDKNPKDDILLESFPEGFYWKNDFMVLRSKTDLHVPNYKINPKPLTPLDEVYVIGYPWGETKVVEKGRVANIEKNPIIPFETKEVSDKIGDFNIIQTPIIGGFSGSPYFTIDKVTGDAYLNGLCNGLLWGNYSGNFGAFIKTKPILNFLENIDSLDKQ